MSKSHVSMEAKICPVCGVQHNYDCAVLLDRRLRDSLERETVTGFGFCEEHAKLFNDGYVALIECETPPNTNSVKINEAKRTGMIAHIKIEAFNTIFNQEAPEGGIVFCEPGMIEQLQSRVK